MNLKLKFSIKSTEQVKYCRIMKVIVLFLFLGMNVSFASNSYSQGTLLSINANNKSIKEIFEQIESNSEFIIFYLEDVIDLNRKVTLNVKKQNVETILNSIFKGTDNTFRINDRQITITKKAAQVLETSQQEKWKVTGIVTDINGESIIGASVVEKGTTNGVTTDMDGRYELKVSNSNAILSISYLGYVPQDVKISKRRNINIQLYEDPKTLEEVVVIGYGQQKKESVVASINAISAKELSMPTRSLRNNLAGQIAGVLAVQRSGEPGKDDAEFWIRGISSFAGGTSPLVLVDGIPRSMNDITVDEIESFTVLKDAAATAVYGAEGANGVVLITSKRGEEQKTTLDIRAEFSVAKPTRLPKMLGSYDYLSIYNEAAWEDAGNPRIFEFPYSDDVMELYRIGADPDLYPDTDFTSLLKDFTMNERVTLNLRGGSSRVKYFVSGAFYHENGIFDSQAMDDYDANIGLSRYNIRSNIDIAVTKTTDLSVDISGQYVESSYPGKNTGDIFSHIYMYSPHIFPLRFSDGRFSESPMYNGSSNENPYNMLNESGYQKTWKAYIQSKFSLNQNLDFITKGLSLKLTGSFDADYNATNKRTKTPTTYRLQLNEEGEKEYIQVNEGSPNLTNFSNTSKGGEKRIYLEGALNYKRVFNDVHDVFGTLLYMQKDRQTQSEGLPYKKQSIVGRVSYGYDSRYMIEASFGLTGSENFAKGYRYGTFPAVGLAWYISNEKFMKGIDGIINKLKIRASFGLTGNDNIGGSRFPYREALSQGAAGYPLGFIEGANGGGTNNPGNGIIEDTFASPFLSWEVEEKKNIGLDLGLFRGQIDLSIDIFKNDRRDILMQRKTVSSVTGFRKMPWQNFGKVTNRGFDGNIVFKQNIQNVNLSFRGNVTYAKNKIIEFDEVEPRYAYQRYTGHSLNTPLLYVADGLYTNDDFVITENPVNGSKSYELKEGLARPSAGVKPGDIKYFDLNDDGKIDNYDRTYNHGYYSQNPEWVYGFGLNVEYKGFYTGIFFQGVANASINLKGNNFVPFTRSQDGPLRKEAFSHWSSRNPENQEVLYPRLHTSMFNHNEFNSTWWYRSGNFLRLKNLEFGYQFEPDMLQKAFIKNARIYVQGNNIAVWDDIKMWDPELGTAGSGAKYPINMTWTVGLELSF